MKKILFLFLSILMCFTLIGCGKTDKEEEKKKPEQQQTEDKQQTGEKTQTDKLLDLGGLDFSKIEPDEKYYRVSYDDDETFTFFMETTTEKNVGKYVHKVYNACKNISTDKKIYDATFDFYMHSSNVKELNLPSIEEINSNASYAYIAQFGYYYNGNPITITIGSLSDIDSQREGKYYPVYTIAITI